MSKKFVGFGVVALVLGVTGDGAEAKLVRYEIDGKRYSYSTNNRQQTREAQERINAANSARDAKARAEAELAANPIARIFGSQVQREAAEAQARIQQAAPQQTAAQQDNAESEATGSVKRGRRESRRFGRGDRRALREARMQRERRFQRRAALSASPTRADPGRAGETPSAARIRAEPAPKVESTSVASDQPARNTPPESGSRESVASSLMDFVNQVRRAPAE